MLLILQGWMCIRIYFCQIYSFATNIMQKHLQQVGDSYVVFQNYGGHVIFIVNLSLKGKSRLKSYILKKTRYLC